MSLSDNVCRHYVRPLGRKDDNDEVISEYSRYVVQWTGMFGILYPWLLGQASKTSGFHPRSI